MRQQQYHQKSSPIQIHKNKNISQLNQISDYRLTAPMFERTAKDTTGKVIALSSQENNALIAKQYEQSGANG